MKFSRMTLAAALSGALVLSACSDGSTGPEAGEESPTTAAPTAGTQAESATATGSPQSAGEGDSATATVGADSTVAAPGDDADSTAMMTTDEAEAVMSVDEAEKVATSVLEARLDMLKSEEPEDLEANLAASVRGSARDSAEAAHKLESVFGKSPEAEAEEIAPPNVLSISREDGEAPHYIFVQTVPESDGVPVVHLLSSESGEEDDFRIVWEAPMLPSTAIPTFDRRSVGTPVLRSGQGDLVQQPRETLQDLAEWISWPSPPEDEDPDLGTRGYAPAVRAAAESQAESVSAQASLREKNWLVSDDTVTLMFEDGTGLVLGTLLRDTTFTVNSGSYLTPPDSYKVLSGEDGDIAEEAVLRTLVFLAMHVPSDEVDLKPEVLAAKEQLVDAWGS